VLLCNAKVLLLCRDGAKWLPDLMPFFKHAQLTEQQRLLLPYFPPDRILFVIDINLWLSCRYASCCWLGWSPAAFGVGHVRSDVYVGKVWMHGMTKRPYYVFVFVLYASHASEFRTALRNQWCAVPCHTSRRRGRVPRESMSPGPCTPRRAHRRQLESVLVF
jgi:hypothetical protein